MIQNEMPSDKQSLGEVREVILQTIKVRRVTLSIFLIIAVSLRFGTGLNFPLPLIFSPLMWGLLTYPFERLIKTRKSKDVVHNIHFGFFAIEVIILTYLIHIIGGVEWIGIAYYLFSVIYANFFLPRKKAWTITFLAIGLFSLMSYGEYVGLIPHWSLFSINQKLYQNSFYVITTILAGGVGIYVSVAFTVQMFADVFRRQNRSLRERESKLERLWEKLITAREEERKRIARRLHDELGQTLMGIKLKLDVLNKTEKEFQLEEVTDLVEDAIEESRNLSHQLRPSLLDELGLGPALRELVENFSSSTGIDVDTSLSENLNKLDLNMCTVIYRAVQELLNNAHKHGQASNVSVQAEIINSHFLLDVRDDGKGFEPEKVSRKSGLGLKGIEENIHIVGGRFSINSQPGEGTVVRVEIPLD